MALKDKEKQDAIVAQESAKKEHLEKVPMNNHSIWLLLKYILSYYFGSLITPFRFYLGS